MFGNKAPAASGVAPKNMAMVTTIPMEFYAGANPIVTFKKVSKEVDFSKSTPLISQTEKKALEKGSVVGAGRPFHPANLLTSRKALIIICGLIFVFVSVVYAIYYAMSAKKTKLSVVAPSVQKIPVVDVVSSTPVVREEIPSSTPVILESIPTSSPSGIDFPSVLLGDSRDTDGDGLTDREELDVFHTDSTVPDSDNDKYPDGHEVYNLYNPAGKEPMRLIDAGLVKEFINPAFGYALYYPREWIVDNVDKEYRDVLFSTITGEHVEIKVFDKTPETSFPEWFSVFAPREKFADLVEFKTAFKESGLRRYDNLAFYFYTDQKVYALVYHTTDSSLINFRSVLKMMTRSFRVLSTGSTSLSARIIEENTLSSSTPTSSIFGTSTSSVSSSAL